MRKLIVAAFITLDGVMQAPGGPQEDTSGGFTHGGWIPPLADEAFGQAMQTLFSQPFELLLGRGAPTTSSPGTGRTLSINQAIARWPTCSIACPSTLPPTIPAHSTGTTAMAGRM
jgi:hypothetical protein